MPIHEELESIKRGGDAAAGHSAAGELSADNLGDRIEFYWQYPNGVLAHVAGVLEGVSHSNVWTRILVSAYPKTSDISGPGRSGNHEEFNVDHDALVEVFDER